MIYEGRRWRRGEWFLCMLPFLGLLSLCLLVFFSDLLRTTYVDGYNSGFGAGQDVQRNPIKAQYKYNRMLKKYGD